MYFDLKICMIIDKNIVYMQLLKKNGWLYFLRPKLLCILGSVKVKLYKL
jgi:hypothetical protein